MPIDPNETAWEGRLRSVLEAYALPGRRIAYGAQQPLVYLKDTEGMVLLAANNVVPVDDTAGYAKGCFFLKTDSPTGNPGLYTNIGTKTKCVFASTSTGHAVLYFTAVPAAAVACHASVQESAANAFPGPFTSPTIPRSLDCVFAAGWQGGDVTVVGTDQFDEIVSETFTAVAGTIVAGDKVFKTITAASKAAIAGTSDAVLLQTGGKIGLPVPLGSDAVGVLFANDPADFSPPADCPEHLILDATYHSFTPESTPDGAISFKLICNA
jgi:hypothetical protein